MCGHTREVGPGACLHRWVFLCDMCLSFPAKLMTVLSWPDVLRSHKHGHGAVSIESVKAKCLLTAVGFAANRCCEGLVGGYPLGDLFGAELKGRINLIGGTWGWFNILPGSAPESGPQPWIPFPESTAESRLPALIQTPSLDPGFFPRSRPLPGSRSLS